MRTIALFIIYLHTFCLTYAQDKNYFVSASGNDSNDGLSITSPWHSIKKVNSYSFQPGDAIHFEGSKKFDGPLLITSVQSGIFGKPLIIKSYGSGKAIIHGGSANAIEIYNAEFIEVRDLEVKGNGRYNNYGTGIYITTNQKDKMLPGVVIDNIEAHGFYWSGIGVGAASEATKGYEGLRITNCNVFENGMGGIQTWGAWDEMLGKSLFNHKGIYISYTRAFNNYGLSNYTSNWSGTGILMAGVENGLIEYCEAYNNGAENGSSAGGPVGIWLANAKNCIIQHCESYNNKAGKSHDGGGFDIDGGSQECILQYNYSHDNEGAGFALFEWGNNIPFIKNVIRYNISQNDGRKNGYGGLTFWATDNDHKLIDCEVYNNTIYVSKENLVSGTPSALKFIGTHMKGLKIRNNVFYTTEGINMLHSTYTFDTTKIHFQNNNYFDTTGNPKFIYRYTYTSLKNFKIAAAGQEMRGTQSLGSISNPMFINPGGGKTIKPSEGGALTYLTAYMQHPGSPLVDNGMNLNLLFGIDIGERDYYNNKINSESKIDIGANEFNLLKFQTLPQNKIEINAEYINGNIFFNGRISSITSIQRIEYQVSLDGKTFRTIQSKNVKTDSLDFRFSDMVSYAINKSLFIRIKALQNGSEFLISNTVSFNLESQKIFQPKLYPNPVIQLANFNFQSEISYKTIYIRNQQGQLVYTHDIDIKNKILSIDLSHLRPGIYYFEFLSEDNNKTFANAFIKG